MQFSSSGAPAPDHQIRSAKSWTDNQGTHHGDAWDVDPALMAAAARLVVAGMAP